MGGLPGRGNWERPYTGSERGERSIKSSWLGVRGGGGKGGGQKPWVISLTIGSKTSMAENCWPKSGHIQLISSDSLILSEEFPAFKSFLEIQSFPH